MSRYLALIVGVAVLVGLASLGYGFVWGAEQAEAAAADRMAIRADLAAETVADGVEASRVQIAQIAAQPGLAQVFDGPSDCVLAASGADGFPSVRIGIVAADGGVACSSDPEALALDRPHAGSTWLTRALDAPDALVMWDTVDPVTGEAAVVVAARLPPGDAGSPGAAVAFLPMSGVAEQLAHDLRSSSPTAYVVVNEATGQVASWSAAEASTSGPPELDDAEPPGPWTALRGGWISASELVPESPWSIQAGVVRQAVLADAWGTVSRQAAVSLIALLLLSPVLWYLHRQVTRPLQALTRAAVEAGTDPGVTEVPEGGTAETVSLARSFNGMLRLRAGHEAKLVHQATHDPLTGLPTKHLLRQQIESALEGPGPVTLLCVAVRRMPRLTAVLGHDGADQTLAEVAERLGAVVGPAGIVARFGGDEFMLLLTDVQDDDVRRVTAELRRSVGELHPVGAGVELTIGYVSAPAAGATPEGLLNDAYTAMSHARVNDLDITRFDDGLRAEESERTTLEEALRAGLDRNELDVHFQPVVDVVTGDINGVEALVRWTHPTRGAIPPSVFVPIAEDAGLIDAIGSFVLERACAQLAAWARDGHQLRMSVNVAVGQLTRESFVWEVRRALHSTGVPPEQLCLEITESALLREGGQATASLADLRQLGVHVAIDDFGTGYSSLAYLHHLPADVVKIDRSFVSGLAARGRERELVSAILSMASTLGLSVVAEGVETEGQRAVLAELGCEQAQGYLFARPLPAADVGKLLAARRSVDRRRRALTAH
jgi:diguanylate cyclase (GGDEF)-like protein